MRIAIDLNGGDFAPEAAVKGCEIALEKISENTNLDLYGDENAYAFYNSSTVLTSSEQVEFHKCGVPLGYDESPTSAIKKYADSSMMQAIHAVAESKCDGLVSAGNTGALLSGSTLIIKRIPGIKRPALVTQIPNKNHKYTLVLDSGANAECKPEYLKQFAVMGNQYAKILFNTDSPKIGLLNNGTEEEKGNELTKEAYSLLKQLPISFKGNCEAREVMSGDYDVVITDGFTGNILLKSIEGTAINMFALIKEALYSSVLTKIGALMAKPAFMKVKKLMDASEVGGAPLLGVKGAVIKAHGNSNAKAFYNAILQAETMIENNIVSKILDSLQQCDTVDKTE